MNGTAGKTHRFRNSLLNALLVLPPAFLYTVKTDSPVYVLIAAALLAFAGFRKKGLSYRDRPIIYSVTAALILTVLPDLLIVIDDSRNGLFDLLVRSNLAVPLLTYLAALSCAFQPHRLRTGFTAACVVGAMAICGDRFNSAGLTNVLLPFLNYPLRHYEGTYRCMAVLVMVLIPVCCIAGMPVQTSETLRFKAVRVLLLSGCLLLIPAFALTAARYYYANASLMRAVEYYILRIGMKKYLPVRHSRTLSSSVNLNLPLPQESAQFRDEVLLRLKALRPPEYLRYGVYEIYDRGHWLRHKEDSGKSELPAERRTGLVSYTTFTVRESTVPQEKAELYFAGLRTAGLIPVPGSLTTLDAVADSGEITQTGLVSLRQWRADGGCTFYFLPDESGWNEPASPEKSPYLRHVPKHLRPVLQQVLRSAGTADSDAGTAAALQNYFSRFAYTLRNVNIGKGSDPLEYFLTRSRAGHCEFFASAAVLLLRTAGIPARYVTGFFCAEKNPVSGYYLIRSSHAHAWCEAFLDGRWRTVDLTPDNALEEIGAASDPSFHAFGDSVKLLFQQLFADVRRGHFAQGVMSILTGGGHLLLRGLLTLPGMAVCLTVCILLFFRIRRKFRLRNRSRGGLAGNRKRLAEHFARFERRYAAISGRRRPAHQTLTEFYGSTSAAELCRVYERLRYAPEDPPERDLQFFREQTAVFLRQIRKEKNGR